MARSSSKRYRSYREKKSQSKKFRTYLIRISIMLVFYSFFTIFIAISIGVTGDSMSPNINSGNSVIMLPYKNVHSILQSSNIKSFKRGEVVISGTNYATKPSMLEVILDPIVRIFTLQKKSLIYDNRDYNGRGELLRVVGLPGDTVKIKDSTVYVKSESQEFFLSEFELSSVDYDILKQDFTPDWDEDFPFSSKADEIVIEKDHYFLISDNRGTLNDSRIFGSVNKDEIIGKVLLKYWPVNEFSFF